MANENNIEFNANLNIADFLKKWKEIESLLGKGFADKISKIGGNQFADLGLTPVQAAELHKNITSMVSDIDKLEAGIKKVNNTPLKPTISIGQAQAKINLLNDTLDNNWDKFLKNTNRTRLTTALKYLLHIKAIPDVDTTGVDKALSAADKYIGGLGLSSHGNPLLPSKAYNTDFLNSIRKQIRDTANATKDLQTLPIKIGEIYDNVLKVLQTKRRGIRDEIQGMTEDMVTSFRYPITTDRNLSHNMMLLDQLGFYHDRSGRTSLADTNLSQAEIDKVRDVVLDAVKGMDRFSQMELEVAAGILPMIDNFQAVDHIIDSIRSKIGMLEFGEIAYMIPSMKDLGEMGITKNVQKAEALKMILGTIGEEFMEAGVPLEVFGDKLAKVIREMDVLLSHAGKFKSLIPNAWRNNTSRVIENGAAIDEVTNKVTKLISATEAYRQQRLDKGSMLGLIPGSSGAEEIRRLEQEKFNQRMERLPLRSDIGDLITKFDILERQQARLHEEMNKPIQFRLIDEFTPNAERISLAAAKMKSSVMALIESGQVIVPPRMQEWVGPMLEAAASVEQVINVLNMLERKIIQVNDTPLRPLNTGGTLLTGGVSQNESFTNQRRPTSSTIIDTENITKKNSRANNDFADSLNRIAKNSSLATYMQMGFQQELFSMASTVSSYASALSSLDVMSTRFGIDNKGLFDFGIVHNIAPPEMMENIAKIQTMTGMTGDNLNRAAKASMTFAQYLKMIGRSPAMMAREMTDIWEIWTNKEPTQNATMVLKNMGMADMADKLLSSAQANDLEGFSKHLEDIGNQALKINQANPAWQFEAMKNAVSGRIAWNLKEIAGSLSPLFASITSFVSSGSGDWLIKFLTYSTAALITMAVALKLVKIVEFVGTFTKSVYSLKTAMEAMKGMSKGDIFSKLKDFFLGTGVKKDTFSPVGEGAATAAEEVRRRRQKVGGKTPTKDIENEMAESKSFMEKLQAFGSDGWGKNSGVFKAASGMIKGIALGMIAVAGAFVLLGEALVLLGGIGILYNGIKDQVKAGMDGLTVGVKAMLMLSPIIAGLLAVGALNGGTEGVAFAAIAVGILGAFVVGAEALTLAFALAAEALVGLAVTGALYAPLKGKIQQGFEGLKIVSEGVSQLAVLTWSMASVAGGYSSAKIAESVGLLFDLGNALKGVSMNDAIFLRIRDYLVMFMKIGNIKLDTGSLDAAKKNLETLLPIFKSLSEMSTLIGSIESGLGKLSFGQANQGMHGTLISNPDKNYFGDIGKFVKQLVTNANSMILDLKNIKIKDVGVDPETLKSTLNNVKDILISTISVWDAIKDVDWNKFSEWFKDRDVKGVSSSSWKDFAAMSRKDFKSDGGGTYSRIGLFVKDIADESNEIITQISSINIPEGMSSDSVKGKMGLVTDIFNSFVGIWNSIKDVDWKKFSDWFKENDTRSMDISGGRGNGKVDSGKWKKIGAFIEGVATAGREAISEISKIQVDTDGENSAEGLKAKMGLVKDLITAMTSIWSDGNVGLQGIANDWGKVQSLFKTNTVQSGDIKGAQWTEFGAYVEDIRKAYDVIKQQIGGIGAVTDENGNDATGGLKAKMEHVKDIINSLSGIWGGLGNLDTGKIKDLFGKSNISDYDFGSGETVKGDSPYMAFIHGVIGAYKTIKAELDTVDVQGAADLSSKVGSLKTIMDNVASIYSSLNAAMGSGDIGGGRGGSLTGMFSTGQGQAVSSFNQFVTGLTTAWSTLEAAFGGEGKGYSQVATNFTNGMVAVTNAISSFKFGDDQITKMKDTVVNSVTSAVDQALANLATKVWTFTPTVQVVATVTGGNGGSTGGGSTGGSTGGGSTSGRAPWISVPSWISGGRPDDGVFGAPMLGTHSYVGSSIYNTFVTGFRHAVNTLKSSSKGNGSGRTYNVNAPIKIITGNDGKNVVKELDNYFKNLNRNPN